MRKLALLVAVVAMVGAASADAANVTFGIRDQALGQTGNVSVPVGSRTFEITAIIDDGTTTSDGLALWGADLVFSVNGVVGNAAIARPSVNPMRAFDTNSGVTNPPHNDHGASPSGYQGTVSGNSLLQIGGGQNTIGNPGPSPAFPVGTVVEEVGVTIVVVATGTYNVQNSANQTMTLANCFANTIDDLEAGPTVYDVSAATTTCGAFLSYSAGGNTQLVTSLAARKSDANFPGGVCTVTDGTSPFKLSEPHQASAGGATNNNEIRITFDAAPGGGGTGWTMDEATCAAPGFVASPDQGTGVGSVVGNELRIIFTPSLDNAKTYRINVGPPVGAAGQTVQVRILAGDATNDGFVNGADRTAVVSAWTGGGFTCPTDVNNDGATNGADRTAVVSAWTGGSATNCAP